MSAYDITGFLRTAYRPFAYCVPSKRLLNTAYQKGGVTLKYTIFPTYRSISYWHESMEGQQTLFYVRPNLFMSFIKLCFVVEVDRMVVCNKIHRSGKPQPLTPMIQRHVNSQSRFQPNART